MGEQTISDAELARLRSIESNELPDPYVPPDGNFNITGKITASDAIGANGVAPPVQAAHIADPAGGATVDAESRTAINGILVILENLGYKATS